MVDGTLAGRVTTKDGKPAHFVKVAIIPVSPVHPQFTVEADEEGHFEVGGRPPGQYIIGVGLLAPFESAEWKSRVYYPGVPTQKQARIVELGDGEWRTDLNFKVPSSLQYWTPARTSFTRRVKVDCPFGTALGIYTMWVLPAESEQEYEAMAEARAA